MIVIDYNGMVLQHVHTNFKNPADLTLNNLRHYVLSDIKKYNKKYREKYGDLVLCHDNTAGAGYWRRDYFPEYKANRKKARDAAVFDWETFFEYFEIVKEELQKWFPYKQISIPKCEGDDIIGWICQHKDPFEKIMIISADKDFKQLQVSPDIRQWSYNTNEYLKAPGPLYLKEHIIRGDGGDGVPNIYSDGDTFINPSKRQFPVSTKDIQRWIHIPKNIVIEELAAKLCKFKKISHQAALKIIKENWIRNESMVNLHKVPEEYQILIEEAFNKTPSAKSNRLYSYFLKNKMTLMINYIEDFLPLKS